MVLPAGNNVFGPPGGLVTPAATPPVTTTTTVPPTPPVQTTTSSLTAQAQGISAALSGATNAASSAAAALAAGNAADAQAILSNATTSLTTAATSQPILNPTQALTAQAQGVSGALQGATSAAASASAALAAGDVAGAQAILAGATTTLSGAATNLNITVPPGLTGGDLNAALAAQTAAANRAAVTTALDDFRTMLAGTGLEGLVPVLDQMIQQDMTASQIKLGIRKTPEYAARFPGMQALSSKNRAITEGDYIALERGYEQILRSYGLDTNTYGGRADLGKYIGNEVSAKEFEDRVALAKTRVEQQPEVTSALTDMYGINKQDAVGYLLNPEKAMDVINKQVRASELGAAALASKFALGDTAAAKAAQAEAFIGAAGASDFTSLKQTFGRARTLADTQKRLAYLESQGYNEIEAVQAELEQSQPAILASQKRAAREQARFGGQTGVSTYALRSESQI